MPTKLPIVRNISRMLILTFTMFLIRCHDSINMKTNWRMVITKIAILVFLLLSLPITTVWPAVCSRGLGVTWPCSGHPGAHLPWILPYRKARYKMDFKLRITLQKTAMAECGEWRHSHVTCRGESMKWATSIEILSPGSLSLSLLTGGRIVNESVMTCH